MQLAILCVSNLFLKICVRLSGPLSRFGFRITKLVRFEITMHRSSFHLMTCLNEENWFKQVILISIKAKKMYGTEIRSVTPDVPDNVSEAGSTHGLPENKYIREKKVSINNGN